MKTAFASALALMAATAAAHGDELFSNYTVSSRMDPLLCREAYPQSPRDVSVGSVGHRSPRGVRPVDTVEELDMVNVHWHVGAEHFSANEYDIPAPNNDGETEGGWLCHTEEFIADLLRPYDFKYCEDVEVGGTYEVHWVHSTGGPQYEGSGSEPILTDGLGDALLLNMNPFVVVQSQAVVIVSDDDDLNEDFLKAGMDYNPEDLTMYIGSTTGTSYDNYVCSPLSVSWHVDRTCKTVSARTFDNMCKIMKEEFGMVDDLKPGLSRALVSPDWASSQIFV